MEEENVRQNLFQWPLSGEQRGGKRESRLLWKLEAADARETDKGKDGLKTNQVGARKRLGTLTQCCQNFQGAEEVNLRAGLALKGASEAFFTRHNNAWCGDHISPSVRHLQPATNPFADFHKSWYRRLIESYEACFFVKKCR